jgi:Domain of unknown function (DUF4157)
VHAQLQLKADAGAREPSGGGRGRVVPSVVEEVVRSRGRPLDASVRGFMEPRFGAGFGSVPLRAGVGAGLAAPEIGVPGDRFEREADAVAGRVTGMRSVAPGGESVDFSGVQVHADVRAAESARQLGARAFTLGRHIVFGEGEYAPNSPAGRELLAHELSHVMQQTSTPANDRGAAHFQAVGRPRIQGRWRLDRVQTDDRQETTIEDENGEAWSMAAGTTVMSRARTWQETGWVHQKVGGSAQTAHWMRTRYVFKNDGRDNDYLQLRPEGTISGRAKAEDLYFARATGVVWGRVIERTSENPTPGDREMFPTLKDGGVSAATIGDLAEVEADISLGERGSLNVKIPLKKVNQGVPSQFEGAVSPYHEVSNAVDEVEVILGARTTADADIRTAIMSWDVAPWVSRNYNTSIGIANYFLKYNSVPAPTPRRAPTVQGAPGQAAAATARPDLFRDGNASGPRIDNVRVPKDIEVDSDGYVDGPGKGGPSSFAIPKSEKNWWKYPSSKPDPSGIVVRNDHNKHWAWEPARRMKLDEYKSRLRASVPDWSKTW